MKAEMFVQLYNAKVRNKQRNPDEILQVIQDLLKPIDYLDYDSKLKLIDTTLAQIKDAKHPTAERYRCFVCNVISAYTSLEMDNKAFDLLSQNGMIDAVLSSFENEYEFCTTLLNMCVRDKMEGGDS